MKTRSRPFPTAWILVLAVLLASAPAPLRAAEPIPLTASDDSSKSSFTTWNVSGGGTNAPSAENDYVAEGYTIRTPTSGSSNEFAGNSIRFGNAASSRVGALAFCSANNAVVSFANEGAILQYGRFCPYVRSRTYTLGGTIAVASPLGVPYLLEWATTGNTNNIFHVTATIKGESDTELAIVSESDNSSGKVVLNPGSDTSFAGTLTIGSIADHSGAYRKANATKPVLCEYQGSKTWPGTIRLKGGSTLNAQWGSTKWTIGSLALDANSTLLTKIASTDTSTITLTNSLTTAYPVYLTTPDARTSTANTLKSTRWSVLTLPTDKGDLGDHLDDFVLATQPSLFPDSLPAVYLDVSTNAAGTTASLDLVQRQLVRLLEDNTLTAWRATGFETACTNAASWSDGAVPHGDADYVVDTTGFRLCFPPTELLTDSTYVFPGSSITLGNSNGGQIDLYSAADTVDVGVLRMLHNARFWPMCHVNGSHTVTVNGTAIHLLATGNKQSYIRIYGDRLYVVNAPLTGAGRLTIFNNSATSASQCGTIVFTAANTNFTGRIRLSASAKDGVYSPNTLLVTDGRQLGGPLDSFTYDALDLKFGSILAATNDVTLATANRGLFIDGSGVVDVADGATLVIGNTVTFADGATLDKTGAGTLALGGGMALQGASASLAVRAGCVEALCTNALDGVSTTFADGAYLLVDAEAQGDLGTYGAVDLSDNPFGGSLPVALRLPAPDENGIYAIGGIAVATVADAATARSLALSARKVRSHSVDFSVRENADGTATILARVYHPGFVLVVR